MQSVISIPFNLWNRKIFVGIVIKIWFIAQRLRGVSLAPTDEVKIAVKLKAKLYAPFMTDGIAKLYSIR